MRIERVVAGSFSEASELSRQLYGVEALLISSSRVGNSHELLVCTDVSDDDVPGTKVDPAKQQRFAAATAVLVLQELADDGSKLQFLVSLARLLQPGAPLLLIDLMGGGSGLNGAMEQQFLAAQNQFQLASGLELELSPSCEGVFPIGEARRSALLNAAGFSDPIRVFQALQYEGVVAMRRQ